MIASLIYALVVIAIVGLVIWAITTAIPMPPPIRTVIIAIGGIIALLMVLQLFGLVDGGLSLPRR